MRRALSRFASTLREDGLAVSPAELIDAAAALGTIDVSDREALRETLRLTLVKRRADAGPFERAFARFFSAPARVGAGRQRRRARPSAGQPAGEAAGVGHAARAAASASGRGGGAPAAGHAGQPPRTSPAEPRRPGAKSGSRMHETSPHPRRRVPVILRAPRRDAEAASRALAAGREPHRPARLEDRRSPAGPPPPIARKPFRDSWTAAETAALAAELARLLARLRLRRVRRRRRARRGSLWVQRIVRASVGHDGVPFRLVRRAPQRREPRLLVLVDVSHSVRRAAAAFMTIVAGLTRSFRDVRAYFFVDHVVDLESLLPRLARLDGSGERLAALARAIPELNDLAPSDYGRVLYQVHERELRRIRRDTVILILGDARTNRLDPMPWTLESLRTRARRIVWLVPEPVATWNTGDSVIGAYAPHLDAICEAADLEGLVHGLGRTLRI